MQGSINSTDNVSGSAKLSAALDYVGRGWYIFPAQSSGEKKSHKSAKHTASGRMWGMTLDEAEVRADFTKWPDANIGIVTGVLSGLFVIETDTAVGHNTDGAAELAKLEQVNSELPETLMAISPTGSIHRFFAHPGSNCKVWNSDNYIAPGVDCRGDGGMVIGAGSVRPDRPGKPGGTYRWVNPGAAIATCSQWMLDLVCKSHKKGNAKPGKDEFEFQNGPPREESDLRADPDLVVAALAVIPNDIVGWENWNRIAMAAWDATKGDARVFAAFDIWSQKNKGKYNAGETAKKWTALFASPPTDIGAGTLFALARDADPSWRQAYDRAAQDKPDDDLEIASDDRANAVGVTLHDFYAFMPTHNYVFAPSRELWPAASVNSRVPPVLRLKANGDAMTDENGNKMYTKANVWLDDHRSVEMMTWAPGLPLKIPDRLISEGGWIMREGVATLNLYRPSMAILGDAVLATPWVELVRKVYPNDADEIFDFCAHRRQKPEEKINHGLILGGAPGIGKDTMLEGLKYAVGPWNFKEVSPQDMMEGYNDYMKSVVLRISEVRDLGEINRFAFYDHMKTILATPPDVMRVNAKYIPQHYVLNVAGIIYTTNYKTNGIYLPADDRRTYVAWSDLTEADFQAGFFTAFWDWYEHQDGYQHVAAFLAERDLLKFNPKATPKKTAAFWAIVDANVPQEQSELADVLDAMSIDVYGRKNAINATTLIIVAGHAEGPFQEWLLERKNRRAIPHRFEKGGFVPVRSDADDGLWVISKRRQVIYARATLSLAEQRREAQKLANDPNDNR
jgi:hypothetical protein